ncbi:MAG: hypothetical protein COB59_06620 [Rhodospirillaceae bacterium]|nr:MAG: hypothetical protein COB59_06620 [Rhodospirillaceae bacterium]
MSNHKGRSKLTSRTRRQFIVGLGALSTTALLPFKPLLAGENPIEPFLKVSSLLTGIALDKTYTELGNTIWSAVILSMLLPERNDMESLISKLAKLPNDATDIAVEKQLKRMHPNLRAIARKIARVWYTGRITYRFGRVVVINYDEALVWRACDFTKPPVTCGGEFGYWNKPYQGGMA